jgi:hypothetical protein
MADWHRARATRPCSRTVVDRVGSWRKAIDAAGLEPRGSGRAAAWTRTEVLDAMLAWRRVHGCWPSTEIWRRTGGTEHPSARRTLKVLGTRSWSDTVAMAERVGLAVAEEAP